jgi:DNA repair protein RecO
LGQEVRLITHRLTRDEDKDVRIYGLLLTFFEHLNAGELDGALLKYFYLFKLLDYLGLLPDLYTCRETGQALQPGGNFFLIADGGILSGEYVQEYGKPKESIYIHDNTLKILRLFDTLSLEDLPKLNLSSKDLGRMQSLLSQYLQYHTDLSV